MVLVPKVAVPRQLQLYVGRCTRHTERLSLTENKCSYKDDQQEPEINFVPGKSPCAAWLPRLVTSDLHTLETYSHGKRKSIFARLQRLNPSPEFSY